MLLRFTILTDIPVWVRPLAEALRRRGVDVDVVQRPEEIPDDSIVVNRISTRVARKQPELAECMRQALLRCEEESRLVVNGARCLEVGFSKLAQAKLFEACGVRIPRTTEARPRVRSLPECTVLLKPPAGGFGRGILRLEPGEPPPESLPSGLPEPWVEQEVIAPVDGAVHRTETLGGKILYEASSPILPDCFDYCLAHGDAEVALRPGSEVPSPLKAAVAGIVRAAGMELGSVEFVLNADNHPVFIDLNPVSSLHPEAADILGTEPVERIAEYLLDRGRGVQI